MSAENSDILPDKESFLEAFEQEGYVIVHNVFTGAFVDELIPELNAAKAKEAKINLENGIEPDGTLLACPVYGGKFLDVMENRHFFQPFNWILGDSCILWVYTTSCLAPNSKNSTSRIHVDRPHFIPGFNEGVGSLILLDDFTEDNGATWFLPQSHKQENEPDEAYFYRNARRLIAPKGSVFYFNLRMWHAGGMNVTNQWRNALGIGMIRPYYKQRIDLPRAIKKSEADRLSDFARQKLGYYAQPPCSLEEFYNNGKMIRAFQPSEWEKPAK
jgi:ectoine hydroxylase-related dioxygenase (phytanoyl-CoA dioxygenase family)